MNPLNEKHMDRLRQSIKWSTKELRIPRQNRIEAAKLFVGAHYSRDGLEKRVPVNMLALAVMIYVRLLAARAPRAMFSTRVISQKPTAANMELAINMIPEEIKLGRTLQQMVLEALFSPWGVVKCGLHTVGQALGHDVGEPFVDNVTMDDHFIDMNAKHGDLIDYEGNDYWLDYKDVMESSWAMEKALVDLKPDDYTTRGENGEDRTESTAGREPSDTFSDKLWMRDVWLPNEKLLITYGIKNERIFKVVEWDGPERGPYYKLGFTDVPGQLMPLPPVGLWRDLHELGNSLFRKLENQADGQKSVMAFRGGDSESVQNFKNAKDQDGITYTGTEPALLATPGVDQKTLAFFMQVQQLSSYVAGNLDSLGGLAPQTATVGQDKLISEAAGAQLRGMSDSTTDVVRDIFKALAYYEWNDPIKRRLLEKPVPGMAGMTIPVDFSKKSKKGKFDSYNLDIDVFSMQENSPTIMLQKLMTFVERLVLPLAPLIQQVGGSIDVQAILQQAAKYADMPDASELVTFVDQPPLENAGQAGAPAGKPANTTRQYDRVSSAGQTPGGASANMQQLLLGGNPGGDQAAQ
jgi:hypothetical protein